MTVDIRHESKGIRVEGDLPVVLNGRQVAAGAGVVTVSFADPRTARTIGWSVPGNWRRRDLQDSCYASQLVAWSLVEKDVVVIRYDDRKYGTSYDAQWQVTVRSRDAGPLVSNLAEIDARRAAAARVQAAEEAAEHRSLETERDHDSRGRHLSREEFAAAQQLLGPGQPEDVLDDDDADHDDAGWYG